MVDLSERCLYFSLLIFWLAGFIMLAVQHPYNCRFFNLPATGKITEETPHENPEADWFFRLTHVYTLTPYAWFSCFVQLILLSFWFAQMSFHELIERRISKEQERGKLMRESGWGNCLRSIFVEEDDDDITTQQQDPEAPPRQNMAGTGHERRGFRCVCGCCYCFSTSFALLVVNLTILFGLIYLLFLGYGTLESTARSQQNPECKSGLASGVYMFVLNAALCILWIVLLLVQCLCTAKNLAQEVVRVGEDLRHRVHTRKGGKRANGRYAQVGVPDSADIPTGEIELDLQEENEEDGQERTHHLEDHLGMEEFLEDEDDHVHDQHHTDMNGNVDVFRADEMDPPSAAGANGTARHAKSKPHASQSRPLRHSPPPQQPTLDDDTKEMLEMMGTSNSAVAPSPPPNADQVHTYEPDQGQNDNDVSQHSPEGSDLEDQL